MKFLKITQFPHLHQPGPTKYGRYHSSHFETGPNKWAVGMYFLLEPGDNRETIVKEAILLLNESGKFGNLQFYKATFLSGKLDYVSLILVTDEKKNRNFWGKGLSGGTIRRRRRRK